MIFQLMNMETTGTQGHSVQLLRENDEARLVLFQLENGHEVAPHSSPCRVYLYCVRGKGSFQIGEASHPAEAGTLAICPPGELHGITASREMVVLAVIAPSPAARETDL